MSLVLTIAVGVVMALGGYFILRQREEILARALQNELYAHAVTLQLTLEDSYRAGRIGDAQRPIDNLSANPRVFSVILFDEKGRVAMFSNPLESGKIFESPDAQRVIARGEPVEILQRRGGAEVYSFIMPIHISAARRIVEEHDGWIEAANREEGGAAFTIWLPKVETSHLDQRNTQVESEKRRHQAQ